MIQMGPPFVVYGADGAAKDPTTSYTQNTGTGVAVSWDGSTVNQLVLELVTAGTVPTSVEYRIEVSFDGGSTWRTGVTESVSSGLVTVADMAYTILAPANGGRYHPVPFACPPRWRVSAKRTAGDATSTLLVRAQVGVA